MKNYLYRISPNKSYPPKIDSGQTLFRERLVKNILFPNSNKKLILIRGQAGQGKSILAIQFLNYINGKFAWLQSGNEDKDPIIFFIALRISLQKSLPDFSSPILDEMIEQNVLTMNDLKGAANILFHDLNNYLNADFYIVFDDIHLIEIYEHTLSLLEHFLQTTPAKIHFILTCRREIKISIDNLRAARQVCELKNDLLAFTKEETEFLYQTVFDLHLTNKQYSEIHDRTEGWIMGLLIARYDMIEGGGDSEFKLNGKEGIFWYFDDKEKISSKISAPLWKTLLKLSLLKKIPVELAILFSEVDNIKRDLSNLVSNNFFTISLSQDDTVFRFHHLFREVLESLASKELSAEERKSILLESAKYFLNNGKVEEALDYYFRASDFKSAEEILRNEGLYLVHTNNHITLNTSLSRFPMDVIVNSPWLSFLLACCLQYQKPQDAYIHFKNANNSFLISDNKMWTLLSTVGLIHFHLNIDGNFYEAMLLIRIAEDLYSEIKMEIDILSKIHVCRCLAAGLDYIEACHSKAENYLGEALQLATNADLFNIVAELFIVAGYGKGRKENWEMFADEIEKAYPLLFNPKVSIFNKVRIRTMQLNLLERKGDFSAFSQQLLLLEKEIEQNGLDISATGHSLFMLQADMAISSGCFEDALKFAEAGMTFTESAKTGDNPSLRAIFLAFQGLAFALLGQKQEALATVKLSVELTERIGSKWFFVMNYASAGKTYACLENTEQAEFLFEKALEHARQISRESSCAGVYVHRAYLKDKIGNDPEQDVKSALHILKESGHVHFYSCVPHILQRVLQLAVINEIEVVYARKLSKEKLKSAIFDDGTVIPLLELNFLGTSEMSISDKRIPLTANFSLSQQELLVLVASSPGMTLNKDTIKLVLWPDSSEEKVASNFDTLLYRLKKQMDLLLKPYKANDYLYIEKGQVCLKNCLIDTDLYRLRVNYGLECARKNKLWQAETNFLAAKRIWKGRFAQDINLNAYSIDNYRLELDNLHIKICRTWATLLIKQERIQESVEWLSDALSIDSENEEIVKIIYHLLMETRQPVKARQVLNNYENTLKQFGFSCKEIEQIIISLRT